ncbi:hypothetical protein [Saccharibacillus kuerlensis]|uniref:DUF2642 domain-containing protein n=1 Tax=Saccharibacillus kuerlensis TaxID=459527 RepID=A0ABQ2KRW8_9BACL|nr:hypothetical protein [Saccharibacillus kuerlensis]GGN91232.1 hypothetical protein GCM10010969_02650 [Saccharibacillus kuerlensis]
MISDEQLNAYRLSGEKVRVVRDGLKENDVRGIVVAWDDTHVLIRRPNRNVVKLDRNYIIQPSKEERIDPTTEVPEWGAESGNSDSLKEED